MSKRSHAGFMNHTVQFLIVALGIWGAIATGTGSSYFRAKKLHRCAVELDAAVADPSGIGSRTCPVSGVAFEMRDGKVCHAKAGDSHGPETFCASASERAADAHPMPGMLKPVLIVVISFVVLVGGALFLI